MGPKAAKIVEKAVQSDMKPGDTLNQVGRGSAIVGVFSTPARAH